MDDAITHYRDALALEPDLAGALNNLANALVARGRAEEALSHFEAALKLDPNLIEAHINLGTTLLQQGKSQSAAAQFERALIAERVKAGMARAKKQGRRLGRPPVLNGEFDGIRDDVMAGRLSQREAARRLGVGRGTIARALAAAY